MEDNIYYGIQYVQILIFLIAVIGSIFEVKGTGKQAVLKGIAAAVTAFILGFLINSLSAGLFGYLKISMGEAQIKVLYTLAAVINMVLIVSPVIFAVAVILGIFDGNKKAEIFMSVLFLLVLSAITGFFQEITYNICSPGQNGSEREYPARYIMSLTNTVWMALTYGVYFMGFRKRIREILKLAEEQIGKIILLPCISYAAFQMVNAVLFTYGISLNALEASALIIAVVVKISVVVMYVLMYWAIFQAITVGAGEARIKAELDVAGKIQLSALPGKFPAFPERKEIDIYAAIQPAKEVGGDFYDFFFVDDERLAVLVADVSGKGVPAALFMMSGQSVIRNQALLGMEPGEIFRNTNNQLVENNQEGMFITAFLGILNVYTGELKFCNAGHNAPYILHLDGQAEQMQIDAGFVLAGLENIEFCTEKRMLKPGEKLVLYTDGVTEAADNKQDMYTEQRLETVLSAGSGSSVREVVERVTASVAAFSKGAEQADDITVLAVEWRQLSG